MLGVRGQSNKYNVFKRINNNAKFSRYIAKNKLQGFIG